MKSYSTVIFDLDGTLLNTLEDLTNATNQALRECGYPEHTMEDVKGFVGNGIGMLIRRALPPELCRPDDGEVLRRGWHLLALDRAGARRLTARGGLRCRTLLLPQGVWTEPLAVRQAVSYGPSPQSTLTLSSLTRRGVLCVQRQVTALDGSVIEPQDIPLPEAWGCWETEPLLRLAGVYLLLGRL